MSGAKARWGSAPKKPAAEPYGGGDGDKDGEGMVEIDVDGEAGAAAAGSSSSPSKGKPVSFVGPDGLPMDPDTKEPLGALGVLKVTTSVRAETIDATKRVLRDLETIKALEEEALNVLHKDLERIYNIEGDLCKIDSTMTRAKAEITALGRKLVRDGLFKVCCTLLLCAIIVTVTLVITDAFGGITGGEKTVVVVTNHT